ncbi:ABC transporter permease [Rubritalea marina]|uniref:ABC transporter permease n=1 Tax=Rubritalea marina TaxID=361055 RepID=UPI000380C81A|nr:ABC transporter permease [Rubritalea marina]
MKLLKQLKYSLLKVIDLSGLTFLAPIVRLCYGEEPKVQLQKIGQWILVPIAGVCAFLFLWHITSGSIQTKSGTLPNPVETWQGYNAIDTQAEREGLKKTSYELVGEERDQMLADAEDRLAEVKVQVAETNAAVTAAKEAVDAQTKELIAPLDKEYKELKSQYKAASKARKAVLVTDADSLKAGNVAEYNAYYEKVEESVVKTAQEKEELSILKKKIDKIREIKSPEVAKALLEQTFAAEEAQYLSKQIELLSDRNRAVQVETATGMISTYNEEFLSLTGKAAYDKARSIAKAKERLSKMESSSYAQPATIWYQVKRSIFCVFTGFIIGTAIAVPIGILCGLNSTFMAAMTPFIAIFKPVSPIVWLPIALIIVSGLIPDPDNNPLMLFLWDLPLIGEYKINPAFIASAVTVALCSLWATLANTALGVASIDKDHMNVARVLKLGFFARLFKIVIPSALPLIFAGLRISLGVGWMVLIAAELLSSSEGIGKFVWDQFNNGASDSLAKMMVVVFLVGIIGLILDRIMIVFQRMVTFEGSVSV